jgi:hypothetical protein
MLYFSLRSLRPSVKAVWLGQFGCGFAAYAFFVPNCLGEFLVAQRLLTLPVQAGVVSAAAFHPMVTCSPPRAPPCTGGTRPRGPRLKKEKPRSARIPKWSGCAAPQSRVESYFLTEADSPPVDGVAARVA